MAVAPLGRARCDIDSAGVPARLPRSSAERAWLGDPDPLRHRHGASSIATPGATARPAALPPRAWAPGPQANTTVTRPALAARFPDLRRRFVFEYYPWYDTDPWYHWNDDEHTPPIDVVASSMPRLGPYDTYDLRILEQHARWMAEAGVGAINLSWWGRGTTPISRCRG